MLGRPRIQRGRFVSHYSLIRSNDRIAGMADQIVLQEGVFKALANRRRIAIILHLKKRKESSVGDIAEAIRLSIKATSKHLAILANVGILEKEQRSLEVFYRISNDMASATRSIVTLL